MIFEIKDDDETSEESSSSEEDDEKLVENAKIRLERVNVRTFKTSISFAFRDSSYMTESIVRDRVARRE